MLVSKAYPCRTLSSERRIGSHCNSLNTEVAVRTLLLNLFTLGLFIWAAGRFAFCRSKDFHSTLKILSRFRGETPPLRLRCELLCVPSTMSALQFIIVAVHWRRSKEFCLMTFMSSHYSSTKIDLKVQPKSGFIQKITCCMFGLSRCIMPI